MEGEWRLGHRSPIVADNWFPIECLSDNSAAIVAWALSSSAVTAEERAAEIVRDHNDALILRAELRKAMRETPISSRAHEALGRETP